MTIARSANIRAMLDAREEASDAHKYAVDQAVTAMIVTLTDLGYNKLPADDMLAEVEGVVSNYLLEAGYR